MRISDWSSDVCSSDLRFLPRRPQGLRRRGCEEVMAMRIGFVGLGNMGRPMAANLAAAGHEMIVGDLNRAAVDDFVATHGARPANGLASLAPTAEILITCLPNGKVVPAIAHRAPGRPEEGRVGEGGVH